MTGSPSIRRVSADAAETMALGAVTFLAADEARLSAFMAATGCSVGDLAALVMDRSFLASVLDFVLSDEALAAAFSADKGLAPGALADLRQALPGGDLPHWT
jgi:hypothetical protein